MRKAIILITAILLGFANGTTEAQFVDHFEDSSLEKWEAFSGDGEAGVNFTAGKGFAKVVVDARSDKYNIWWAVIKRNVTNGLHLDTISTDKHRIRFEARLRSSHAPRRVNLHLYTQRVTNHHLHLMEYEIPDTTHWHTISLTAKDLPVQPDDSVFAQLALMDWGKEIYQLDVDYVKAFIVDPGRVDADKGNPISYRPEIPDLDSYEHELGVRQDAVIDQLHPGQNFSSWGVKKGNSISQKLSVSGSQNILFGWDFSSYKGDSVKGWSVLKIHPEQVFQLKSYSYEELGQIRVSEIINDASWDEKKVTWKSFTDHHPIYDVINPQMIMDTRVEPGKTVYITIPENVMQRLIDGASSGLAIQALGSIHAIFPAKEGVSKRTSTTIFFNTE
mgnify:CR=1 FL=1